MTAWNPAPHGPLIERAPGLWTVTGPVPGMALTRTAVFARHQDTDGQSGLLVHSAITLDEDTLAQLLAHGPIRWLVVPNAFHRLDAPAWKARFPDVTVICPPAARSKVEEKVAVDATFDTLLPRFTVASGVTLHPTAGVNGKEWALKAHHADGTHTLIVTDTIFNMPHQSGFGGLMLRVMGSSGGPRVTRIAKLFLVANNGDLANDLRALAAEPGLVRVIPNHGEVIEQSVSDVLRSVANTLRPAT